MSLSFSQKLQIFVVKSIISFLWFLDNASSNILISLQSAFLALTLSAVTVFFAHSYKSNYLANIFEGMFYQVNGVSSLNSIAVAPHVLGANTAALKAPTLVNDIKFPEVTAKSILITDKASSKVLFEKNSNTKLASASTTKLMTALVALDIYQLDEVLTVSEYCASVDSTKADLPIDTSYRVKDLVASMLISSAGDAACTLAYGKNNYDEFLFLMNQKAYKLNMNSSYFTNPIGLDGIDKEHFSDAQDLYKMSLAAMANADIQSMVKTKEFQIKSIDESFIGNLYSTNKLLWEIPNTIGVKTGTTVEAGEVLIYELKDETKDLVIIVMGSEDRFSDTRALLNWTIASYSWN